VHVSFRTERVDLGRANKDAVFWFAPCAADLVVDLYVSFFVDFEHIPPEFLFHLHVPAPLDFQQIECVLHC